MKVSLVFIILSSRSNALAFTPERINLNGSGDILSIQTHNLPSINFNYWMYHYVLSGSKIFLKNALC